MRPALLLKKLLITPIFIFSYLTSQNDYPIVLVHGFMGWGPDEMGSYNYWGGKKDMVEEFEEQGFKVLVTNVGPVSSNWDRAVELYYQIKGGQVDYGKGHAEKFGIVQKPMNKKYRGLYPQWSDKNPVHIVGHSMGGQTARMLDYLLRTAITDSAGFLEKSNLLGKSNNGYIKSISTISTPHDGTTLTTFVTTWIPFLQDMIAVAAVVGNSFYDFDLEQWGFKRNNKESWSSYFKRMQSHPAWGTKNIVSWDVSIQGAREINSIATANPEVYYFSFINSNTVLDSSSGRHVPHNSMSFIIRSNARLMGMKRAYFEDGTPTDTSWFENDGIVNKKSMYGPTTGLNGADPITNYSEDEILIPGQWYAMKELKMDHRRMVGHGTKEEDYNLLKDRYLSHLRLLATLPK